MIVTISGRLSQDMTVGTDAEDTVVAVPVNAKLVHLKSKTYQPLWIGWDGASWEKVVTYLDGTKLLIPAGSASLYIRKPIERRRSPNVYESFPPGDPRNKQDDCIVSLQVLFE